MERIKAAIEKAKKNQSETSRHKLSEKKREDFVDADKEHAIENLEYKKTKIVDLDLNHLLSNRIIAHSKNNPQSGVFDLLRTQVLQKMKENGWRTLAITSPTEDVGKTVISINLAISVAHHSELTSLLVDLDLKRPKVADYLGIDVEVPISDVLNEKASIESAIINPGIKRFVTILSGEKVANSTELITSRNSKAVIQELKHRYNDRVIIFDLPPLLNTDDTIAILPEFDCVLMIVANGMNTKHEIDESFGYLHSANLLGVVLNKAEGEHRNYY